MLDMDLICRAYAVDLADWIDAEYTRIHPLRLLYVKVAIKRSMRAHTTTVTLSRVIQLSWADGYWTWGEIELSSTPTGLHVQAGTRHRQERGSILIEPGNPTSFDQLHQWAWNCFRYGGELGEKR